MCALALPRLLPNKTVVWSMSAPFNIASLAKPRQQAAKRLDDLQFDLLELRDLCLVLPMVRQTVLIGRHPVELRHHSVILDHQADDPRRIRFQNHRNHAEHALDPSNQVGGVQYVGGRHLVDDRLGLALPRLDVGEFPLGGTYGVEVGVQLPPVCRTDTST